MKVIMRSLFIFALLSTLGAFSFGQSTRPGSAPQGGGVFVHITHGSDDPHRLLMGLQLAATMAEDKKDVIVYCDIASVRALTKSAADISLKPFPTLHELLSRLVNLNVPVMACPTCMKVAGISSTDLRPGVTVATKDRFFSFTNGRILSLDY
jgi:predicted peroxiredoxin